MFVFMHRFLETLSPRYIHGGGLRQARNVCWDMGNFLCSLFLLMTIEGDCVLDDTFPSQVAFLVARSRAEVEEILGTPLPSHLRIFYEASTKDF